MTSKARSALDPRYARLPRFTGFTHGELTEWLSTIKPNTSTSFELGNRESVFLDFKAPGGQWANSVMFVRRLVKDWRKADPQKDYLRFEVFDVEGTLRTDAKTKAGLAFIAELYPKTQKAIARSMVKRAKAVKSAVRASPVLDRPALTELMTAATWGKVKIGPLVDAVMLAARDPVKYIAAHREACAEFGIDGPVKGLHEVALQQQLPDAFLLGFDWKESMEEVVPMVAHLLKAGPRLTLDVGRFEARYAKWNLAPREQALAEIAKTVPKVALVHLKVDADAVVVVCVDQTLKTRVRSWARKLAIPMTVL